MGQENVFTCSQIVLHMLDVREYEIDSNEIGLGSPYPKRTQLHL